MGNLIDITKKEHERNQRRYEQLREGHRQRDRTDAHVTPPAADPPEAWLRTQAIADRFEVSQATIRRWIREEGLPSLKHRRVRFFNVAECDQWLRRRGSQPVLHAPGDAGADTHPGRSEDTPGARDGHAPRIEQAARKLAAPHDEAATTSDTQRVSPESPAAAATPALQVEILRELHEIGTRLADLAGRALEGEPANEDPRPRPGA